VKRAKRPAALKTALTHAALIVLSVIFLIPFFWLVSTSLKGLPETVKQPPVWVPKSPQWVNYRDAFYYDADALGYVPFLVYTRNTILLCWLGVVGTVFSNAVIACGFARMKFKGRDLFFFITLATMMVPFPVLMVPTYSLFKWLGWIGGFRPLWVPAFFGSAFNIFLLRQFFKGIPFELSEAATIDGASEWRIFTNIIVPLSKPALGVVALFTFLGTWTDFLGPHIYLMDQKTFTLSLGLQFYQSQNGGTQWNLLMAATAIVILPVVLVFFFTQRLLIRGIALTGLKG
jgi:multiple sugar transport system permease protein